MPVQSSQLRILRLNSARMSECIPGTLQGAAGTFVYTLGN